MIVVFVIFLDNIVAAEVSSLEISNDPEIVENEYIMHKNDTEHLIISEGVYKIGSRAFYQWNYLLDVIIGDLTSIRIHTVFTVSEIRSSSFVIVNI